MEKTMGKHGRLHYLMHRYKINLDSKEEKQLKDFI
jgi:hypothetical protein